MGGGKIFIDCGAHVGEHTRNMLARSDISSVLAIEAIPELAKKLQHMAEQDSRLKVFQCALGKHIGTTEFHIAANAPGYSGIKQRDIAAVQEWKSLSVNLTTLDKLLTDLSLTTPIELIKLDLEGGEFDALLGARHMLMTQRPFIIFENGLQQTAVIYDYNKNDFFDYFDTIGYAIYDFFGNIVNREYWDIELFTYMFVGIPHNEEATSWYMEKYSKIWP